MKLEKTKLNIKEFFENLNNLNYILVKKPDHFPNYYVGSDLDIICNDKKTLIQRILIAGNKYVENHNYEIKVSSNEKTKHTKVDFYFENEIEIRFDIHENLPKFKKINVRKDYIHPLLTNKKELVIEDEFTIYIPSYIDELTLRYIEYFEWFEKRPDKIKHLEYIEKHIANKGEREKFFDYLHRYIKMTDTNDISKPEKRYSDAKITHTDFKTKIKRELKYRTPLFYKMLLKIKRIIKN